MRLAEGIIQCSRLVRLDNVAILRGLAKGSELTEGGGRQGAANVIGEDPWGNALNRCFSAAFAMQPMASGAYSSIETTALPG